MNINFFLKKIKNNKLFNNFWYLFIFNIANFILPFLTFPYLVRVLGYDNFGLLSFSNSIINYFVLLTDYGFNLTATREVSINRNNVYKINEIVSSVYIIKIFLFIISFVIILILLILIPKLNKDFNFYLLVFSSVFGQLLFPIWFFQGFEKMKAVSILNMASKLIYTALIFLLVKNRGDLYLIPIVNFVGLFLVGIISVIILLFVYNISFFLPKITVLKYYLISGWHLFISNISVTLYTSTITVILGFFGNNIIVSYYSIGDKIISAIKGITSPLSQTLFPFLSNISTTSKNKIFEINRKLLYFGTPLFFLGSLILCVFAPYILKILFHNNNSNVVGVLRILAFVPTLIYTHTIFALFTMIVFGKNKEYSRIIISAGILNSVLAFILIPFLFHIGGAICVLLIEIYLLIRYVIYTMRNNLNIFKNVEI